MYRQTSFSNKSLTLHLRKCNYHRVRSIDILYKLDTQLILNSEAKRRGY